MKIFDKKTLSQFDYILLLFILPLICLSFDLINEVSTKLAHKQLMYYGISTVVFLVVYILPIRNNIRYITFLYWIGILLLAAVEFYGVTKLGAKRWLEIPYLNLTLQPSEIVKPIFLVMLGYIICKSKPKKNGFSFKQFLYISLYILLPFGLIAKEPDLGTALILLLVGYGILFVIGVNWKIWVGIVLVLAFASPLIYNYAIKDYQKKRIKDFMSEKPSYHVQQSIITIGSGGLYGKNKDNATQTQLRFLPIATSDFIFAYYVERYGFMGALILIIIYSLLTSYLLLYNLFFKDDYVIRAIATGLALLIFFSMSVNILMVIGFAPVVGLPLPMFSYGGSSFINFIIIFAILENLVSSRLAEKYRY